MRIYSRNYEKFIAPALLLSLGFHLLAAFVPQGAVDFLYGTREAPPVAVRFEVVPLAPEPAPLYRPLEPESAPSAPEPASTKAEPEVASQGTESDSANLETPAAPEHSAIPATVEFAPPAIAEPLPAADSLAVIGAYIEDVLSRIIRSKYYPESCRRLGQQGEVTVGFAISRVGGLAVEASLIGPSPFAPLNRAACRSVERCAPFPPLPDCVRDNYLALKVKILYQLQ
ncbi:MAG: hypothetical protein A3F83_09750 [Candidatus Glassbacteria bacterium RIFCSPLOWO2_12_FULL_58_11]|uniref:TonB C-terminal domain-containing protein n=1 Tax=Candidatus Glassbacteria bacterium RIFCSPLOWO2_12_FULL_58_11 TaxID=1817867 RepID=A0A1F5Z2K1_9BACT|nr:MAG: hypothetical protein A3F83_09750 [Candidatus Glassbacteria bacterium RIFCSPLOWO2_12_FULL_58_11]